MNKDFNDFMKTMDSKDWSPVAAAINSKLNPNNPNEFIIKANIETTVAILNEYHNWLTSEK